MTSSIRFDRLGLQAQILRPPKPMRRTHFHSEVELNHVVRGSVTYLYQGRLRRLEAGQWAMFLGTVPHSLLRAEPDSEMTWLTLPLAWVMSWRLPAPAMRRLLGGDWWLSPPQRESRFAIGEWARELNESNARPGRRLLLEFEACVLWLAEGSISGDIPPAPASDVGLRHVETMATVMAERYREPLDIAEIAQAAGLHPNYAMGIFRRRTGITIREYLVQLRVTHAQCLLLTTDQKIVDVALESGFPTLSVFYETFGRAIGVPPKIFRRTMRPQG